ncbi:MAG: NERD domain-containing protein [Thiotrichales bacterium]|nr:NERD domain-containing protein [Thiotrichales bacterium]
MSDFEQIRDERGRAAEYHVNNTLHRSLGAVRFRESDFPVESYYLFDGIILPAGQNRYTEVDHLLVSAKGIFAIETKSIHGKVFGERNSQKWHSASPTKNGQLYDRGFTNPFKQNQLHISAVQDVLTNAELKSWVNNVVVLVDADSTGWEPGHWGADPIQDLFLSAKDLAKNILARESVFSLSETAHIARLFQRFYVERDALRVKFNEQILGSKGA